MYSYIFVNSRALWRDHIAVAVWSVSREAKDFYVIHDESSNGKFCCITHAMCFHDVLSTYKFLQLVGVYVLQSFLACVSVVLLQMCSG